MSPEPISQDQRTEIKVVELLTRCDAGSCPQLARITVGGKTMFGVVDVNDKGEITGPAIPVGGKDEVRNFVERLQASNWNS